MKRLLMIINVIIIFLLVLILFNNEIYASNSIDIKNNIENDKIKKENLIEENKKKNNEIQKDIIDEENKIDEKGASTYQKNEIKDSEVKITQNNKTTTNLKDDNKIDTSKKTIEDGVYIIRSSINEKYVIDVNRASKENGANVQLYEYSLGNQKRFKVTYLEDGYYSIVCVHSNKALDVKYAEKQKGANVWQYEQNDTDAQKWLIKDVGNGYYSIISKCNGLYVDVYNAVATNGTNIQMCDGNGLNAQKFRFEKVDNNQNPISDDNQEIKVRTIKDGTFVIKSAIDNNFIIGVNGESNNNGANIQLCKSLYGISNCFNVTYLGEGYYSIICVNSNKSLDVKDASKQKGANVWQYEQNGTDAQKWLIKDAGNGYYNIISKCNGLYVDVYNAVAANGTNIQMCDGNGLNAQKFKFEEVSKTDNKETIEEGTYVIRSAINKRFVLDVNGASKENGANVQLYEYSIGNQKRFKVAYIGNGYYNIISKCNGLYVDVYNAVAANGTNIQMCDGNGLNAQKFKFARIDNIPYSEGTYGSTGLKIKGEGGYDLKYYKYGKGENVLFATFALHGYEDLWNKDGEELIKIADNFYNNLIQRADSEIAEKWTIYIFPGINLDGIYKGWTNNGPGRTTIYSEAPGNRGIDLNRCWQIGNNYEKFEGDRNYNGTEGFQAFEALYLRDFLNNNKSTKGQTILIDLHGWTQQLIGDEKICSYFKLQFPENDTSSIGRYGTGYLINWARCYLGTNGRNACAALIELPNYSNTVKGHNDVIRYDFSNRYINSVINMLYSI